MLQYRTLLDRKFGVEFEVSNTLSKRKLAGILMRFAKCRGNSRSVVTTPGKKGWAETRENDYWHVKYDSTCGPLGKHNDFGWEIASYIGKSTEDVENISEAASWLQQHKVETNLNCGLHIHVEVRDFFPEQMGCLVARWVKIEPYLFLLCQPQRYGNPYCRSLRNKLIYGDINYCRNRLDNFWHKMAPTCFETHDNDDKKYTLNTLGYAKALQNAFYDRATVELRLPECLLDYMHVKNWIVLMLNFVQSCMDNSVVPENLHPVNSIRDFFTLLGLQSSSDFWILDSNILNAKIWILEKLRERCEFNTEATEILDLITNLEA